jgi:hypothetical protein
MRCDCDEVLLVVGGHANGMRVALSELVSGARIDPGGAGTPDPYAIRTIQTSQGLLRCLALTSMSDYAVLENYAMLELGQ